MKLKKMHWFGIVSGMLVIIGDLIFFLDEMQIFSFLMGIAVFVLALPFIIGLGLENQREQKVNDMFLEFSRNLAENVATGTPVSKAIINMKRKNYGELNPYIYKLANQIELGISLNRALEVFADDVDNTVIKRAVALIKEAEKAGGEIDYILDSTAKSISEVEKLKKERKSATYTLVVQGYIIFFIFIGIILVMEFKILPLTAGIGSFTGFTSDVSKIGSGPEIGTNEFDVDRFTKPFLYLLLAQGLFAGLVIGKMTEGTLKKGIKHSFVMMIAAYLISTGARAFIPITPP